MHGYRTYNMESHHAHHDASPVDQKPLVVDLLATQYGKPQTPPPRQMVSLKIKPSKRDELLTPNLSSVQNRMPIQSG